MKIQSDGGFLARIGKNLPAESVQGENVGLLQFSPAGAARLFAEASRLLAAGESMAWAPVALNRFGPLMPIRCVDVCGLPWVEVDFPADLTYARDVIWPAIKPPADASIPFYQAAKEFGENQSSKVI